MVKAEKQQKVPNGSALRPLNQFAIVNTNRT